MTTTYDGKEYTIVTTPIGQWVLTDSDGSLILTGTIQDGTYVVNMVDAEARHTMSPWDEHAS